MIKTLEPCVDLYRDDDSMHVSRPGGQVGRPFEGYQLGLTRADWYNARTSPLGVQESRCVLCVSLEP